MYIRRDFERIFADIIRSRKILIVYGSRQTGKTTIIEELLRADDIQTAGVVVLNGDVKADRDLLAYESMTIEKARAILGHAKTLFVDEAQKILDIGLTLKIIHDNLKDVHIVATGSSSFEPSEEVGEPLTGRMASFVLPPLSFRELAGASSNVAEMSRLESRLRLGCYPDVVTADSEAKSIENLGQLCEAYLFKDVLQWRNIRNSEMLNRLLKAIALQLGDEVSYNELGNLVGLDNETVGGYIERRMNVRRYFWRLTTPSDGEIDYIEEFPDGGMCAYEFKFGSKQAKKAKCPAKFAKAYPDATWSVVSRENYIGFVNGEI